MVTFSDRLKSAMEQKHLKQVDLIRIASQQGVKLGKSHISQYVSGKTIPRNDILHFLADTLEVDAGWLSCKTAEDPADRFHFTFHLCSRKESAGNSKSRR